MCIDDKTLKAYKSNKSAFSSRLVNGIDFDKKAFRQDRKGRCAFLNQQGFCDLIINLGEKSLCQVCADHPRFRSFFNDRTEMGLGFCCEQATFDVLTFEDKIMPLLIADDGKAESLDFNQTNVLAFRQKVLDVLQDRSISIDDRIERVLKECKASIDDSDFYSIVNRFYNLERLNKSWSRRLELVKKAPFDRTTDKDLELQAEQFLVNAIYRHLWCAEDTVMVRAITITAIISWWLIKAILGLENKGCGFDLDRLVDIVREYSAEVEYSQNNLDKLFNFAYKFIKIG